MQGAEYQALAMRTNDKKSTDRLLNKIGDLKIGNRGEDTSEIELGGVLNAALGLSGEVGELNDMLKKQIFHEKQLDIDHAKKETGDICWYLAILCESFGWNLDEIMQINIDKLKARYPEGFDTYRANHRQAALNVQMLCWKHRARKPLRTFAYAMLLSTFTDIITRMAWRIFKKPSGTLTNTQNCQNSRVGQ